MVKMSKKEKEVRKEKKRIESIVDRISEQLSRIGELIDVRKKVLVNPETGERYEILEEDMEIGNDVFLRGEFFNALFSYETIDDKGEPDYKCKGPLLYFARYLFSHFKLRGHELINYYETMNTPENEREGEIAIKKEGWKEIPIEDVLSNMIIEIYYPHYKDIFSLQNILDVQLPEEKVPTDIMEALKKDEENGED